MSNPQKRKGDTFERDVKRFLSDEGLKVFRPRQAGFRDIGDLNVSPFILQCKAYADVQVGMREAIKGAVDQARNAGEPFGAGVVKRPRKSIGEAYFVMTLADASRLLVRLREGDEALAVLRRLTEQR